jgi:hypothetical protein
MIWRRSFCWTARNLAAPLWRPSPSKPIGSGASPGTRSARSWASPQLDGFLKKHEVYDYTIDDFDHDLATIRELNEKRKAERPA